MTQVQQTPQADSDNAKSAPEAPRRGPKKKTVVDTTAGKNTESKPQNEEKGTEQSTGVSTSSQTELQAPNLAQADRAKDGVNAQGNTSQNVGGEASGDLSQAVDTANGTENSGPDGNQSSQSQDDEQGIDANQDQSGNVQSQNNENIVVQEVSKVKEEPKIDLIIKVKNGGLKAVYEPHSKTTIEPGDKATIIQCANRTDLKSVLANIDQLNALGKKIKVVKDE